MLDNGNKSAFEKMSLVELSAQVSAGNKLAIEFMRDTFGNETLKKVVPSAKRLSIAAIEHEALIERQRAERAASVAKRDAELHVNQLIRWEKMVVEFEAKSAEYRSKIAELTASHPLAVEMAKLQAVSE